ncbi:MAG: glutamate--tRNA ligase [Burkholderiaceae bacterium]|nr:glutamate--tRNA ligase [Burkholderiaceae bacterium]
MTRKIRTRIAPSPTGFLHLGTARTALYSWAYARHYGGEFVLRIEDTDVARSTQDSVDQILAAMKWLGLDYDEGPIYQMQRLDRYNAVVEQMIAAGTAYRCYCTPEELDAMKAGQESRGEKRRYDGTWRPEAGKTLPPVPEGVKPVVRFKNPLDGDVSWDDLVKGVITINNREIDDLIIVRPDGIPTYNFCVVVDDWDMSISHVFRGDEHVNNTPWQINIFNALGAPLPLFGHVPVILGDDGQKLSKRRGAVSVTAYEEGGYLPEAMLNYLSRLGWSHGDDELFSREQLVQWFDGEHLSKSPAQWDPAKLSWVNASYMKLASDERLARLVLPHLAKLGIETQVDGLLEQRVALFKDRCATLVEMADWLRSYFQPVPATEADLAQHVTEAIRPALAALADKLDSLTVWDKAAVQGAIKEVITAQGIKMPQLAIPVRVLVFGRAQTPSLDAVLALFEQKVVAERLRAL